MLNPIDALRRERARRAAQGADTKKIDAEIAKVSEQSPRVERAVLTRKVSKR